MEPVLLMEKDLLLPGFVLEDPNSYYIYVCKKIDESMEGALVRCSEQSYHTEMKDNETLHILR